MRWKRFDSSLFPFPGQSSVRPQLYCSEIHSHHELLNLVHSVWTTSSLLRNMSMCLPPPFLSLFLIYILLTTIRVTVLTTPLLKNLQNLHNSQNEVQIPQHSLNPFHDLVSTWNYKWIIWCFETYLRLTNGYTLTHNQHTSGMFPSCPNSLSRSCLIITHSGKLLGLPSLQSLT